MTRSLITLGLSLVISAPAFALIAGKDNVNRITQQIQKETTQLLGLETSLNPQNVKGEEDLAYLKEEYANSIFSLRSRLNSLERAVESLEYRKPPRFTLGRCQIIDQDHGGLTDNGSVIYGRKGDYRACARVTAVNPNLTINTIRLITYDSNGNSKEISNLQVERRQGQFVEARGTFYPSQLPIKDGYYGCLPRFGNEIEVTFTNARNERESERIQLGEELINFNSRDSKYRVQSCQ